MSNGKAIIVHLIVELIRKTLYKKWINSFLNHLKVLEETDLSNYATKTD